MNTPCYYAPINVKPLKGKGGAYLHTIGHHVPMLPVNHGHKTTSVQLHKTSINTPLTCMYTCTANLKLTCMSANPPFEPLITMYSIVKCYTW